MSQQSNEGTNGWAAVSYSPAAYRGWQNPVYAFDKRQASRNRAAARLVQQWTQLGTAGIVTPTTGTPPVVGEGNLTIAFPYQFIEKPIVTFGHELDVNQTATLGQYPTFSATVIDWVTAPAGNATLWQGALIGFVVGGSLNQKSLLHYSFSGQAMVDQAPIFNVTGSA